MHAVHPPDGNRQKFLHGNYETLLCSSLCSFTGWAKRLCVFAKLDPRVFRANFPAIIVYASQFTNACAITEIYRGSFQYADDENSETPPGEREHNKICSHKGGWLNTAVPGTDTCGDICSQSRCRFLHNGNVRALIYVILLVFLLIVNLIPQPRSDSPQYINLLQL